MSVGAVDGTTPPGVMDSAAIAGPRRRRRWLKVLALGLAFVLIAAVAVALVLGASYQPVGFGGEGPGLTGQIVSRQVNNFAAMGGQFYIPPQKVARGAVIVSLTNTGPYPVTIESATLNDPDFTAAPALQAEPLRDTGPATYWPMGGNPGVGGGTRLAGTLLGPGQDIVIRLPVTTAGCWMRSESYTTLFHFWVKVKFLFWTHLVPIWWTSPYDQSEGAFIAREPQPASQGGLCPP
jgi:hypothetical protein